MQRTTRETGKSTFEAEGDFMERCLAPVAHEFCVDPRTATLYMLPLTDVSLYGIT